MNKMIISLWMAEATFFTSQAQITVNGAGATFPSPVYRVWAYNFKESVDNKIAVNYQGVGSGAGVSQLIAGTVDFGATDNPLTLAEQEQHGLLQFPMLAGGVVLVVNLPSLKQPITLSGEVLADIFAGRITVWNDAAIAALNPKIKLPKLKITVVSRSDASGTTFIFTHYLSQVSENWAKQIGTGPAVKFPVGIGGQKNPGVCNNVARIPGSIGYTEYTYAIEAKLKMTNLVNAAKQVVTPSPDTFQNAAAYADWDNAPGYYMVLTNQPGEQSWPITGITYILVRKQQSDIEQATAMFQYFQYCFSSGKMAAKKLNYVPLPDSLATQIRNSWVENIVLPDNKKLAELLP